MDTLEFTEVEATTAPEMPKLDVVRLNVTDTRIAELKGEFMSLTVNGIEDKAGLKKVYESRQIVKKLRIGAEKYADKLKDQAVIWQKKVNEEKKRIVSELGAIEDHLQSEEDKIEAEKDRIDKEEKEREAARIQDRMDKLSAYGFGVDYATIKIIDDATFETVLANAKTQFDIEQAAKAEAEQQRLAEIERLKQEREELELLRKQQAEQAEVIRQQKETIEREQAAREEAARVEAKRIADQQAAKAEAARIEAKRIDDEQEAREAEIRAQQAAIEAEKKRIEDERIAAEKETARLAELEAAKAEAAEKARLQAIKEEQVRIQLEKQKAEMEQIERDRQAELAPDKEKLLTLAEQIIGLKLPDLKQEGSKAITKGVAQLLKKTSDYIIEKANSL